MLSSYYQSIYHWPQSVLCFNIRRCCVCTWEQCIDLWIYTIMSHNEAVSWLQWSVDLILPGLSVGLMSQYSGLLPPLNGLTTVRSLLIFRARWRLWLIYCGRVSCFNQRPLDRCGDGLLSPQPNTHPDHWLIKHNEKTATLKILHLIFFAIWLFIAVNISCHVFICEACTFACLWGQ